jgi:hypothetical protein
MKNNGYSVGIYKLFNNNSNYFNSEVFLPAFRNSRIAFCALL